MTEEQKQQRIVELEGRTNATAGEIAAAEQWIEMLEDLKRRYGVCWMHQSDRIH